MIANSNFQNLSDSYLFPEVGRRVRSFQHAHPDAKVIRMDVGDVTLPIIRPVADAMRRAVEEMTLSQTFHGYGPEQGYDFLRSAIAENDYRKRGMDMHEDDIFVSDGAKCDIGNLTDIIGTECVAGIPDPVYPVYVDSNVMAGRTVKSGKIVYIRCDSANDYKPLIPESKVDVIYLCSPNNPTGSVLNREDLTQWVDYARSNGSIIIFDSAYEAFITDPTLPKSIYEIEGAKEVAIEVRSFSKTAGFTGLRCGYTVVPETLMAKFADGTPVALRKLWLRRQTTKFNGASYIVQRGAEAIYTSEGTAELKANIDYYLQNATLLKEGLRKSGIHSVGGQNSPYVWFKSPDGIGSWEMFELLLENCHISSTPGIGFGEGGEGCIRLTGFNSRENTLEAVRLLSKLCM